MSTTVINQVNLPQLRSTEPLKSLTTANEEQNLEKVAETSKALANKKWQYELGSTYYQTQKSAFDSYMGIEPSESADEDETSLTTLSDLYLTALNLHLKKYKIDSFDLKESNESGDGSTVVDQIQQPLSQAQGVASYQNVANANAQNSLLSLMV